MSCDDTCESPHLRMSLAVVPDALRDGDGTGEGDAVLRPRPPLRPFMRPFSACTFFAISSAEGAALLSSETSGPGVSWKTVAS